MVLRGIAALSDADANSRTKQASATKALVAKTGRFVTAQAIQLHGGIGMADECIVGHYFKRLNVYSLLRGSEAFHINRFSKL